MTDPHNDACFTLKNEHTGVECILTREHVRIILLALAGFELTREERIEIKQEYLEIMEMHSPGSIKPEALRRKLT